MNESTAPAGPGARRVRRWLLRIHMYGGLLCSSYLVVYGVSSLLFSHPVGRLARAGASREWTATVTVPLDSAAPRRLAESVAAQLDLVGRITPETPNWTPTDGMTFGIVRPGHEFSVHVGLERQAQVTGRRLGLASVFGGLHDIRQFHASGPLHLWWYFTHLTVLLLLWSACSGIIMWWLSRRHRASGWPVLIGGTLVLGLLAIWLAR